MQDVEEGDLMQINGKSMIFLGASISEKLITPAKRQSVTQAGLTLYNEYIPKKIYVKILFQGNTRDIIDKNISNYAEETKKDFIFKFKDKTTYFKCKPASFNVEETGFNDMLYITAEYECIEFEKEKIVSTSNKTVTFTVGGNTEAPCILELTPSTDLINITITGLSDDPIIVKNLKGNKTLIIDSEEGEVELAGANHYKDFDAWEFPKVKAGSNTVTINQASVTLKIKYKAIWN